MYSADFLIFRRISVTRQFLVSLTEVKLFPKKWSIPLMLIMQYLELNWKAFLNFCTWIKFKWCFRQFLRNAFDIWNHWNKHAITQKHHTPILTAPPPNSQTYHTNTGTSTLMFVYAPHFWLATSVFWFSVWFTFNSISQDLLTEPLSNTPNLTQNCNPHLNFKGLKWNKIQRNSCVFF